MRKIDPTKVKIIVADLNLTRRYCNVLYNLRVKKISFYASFQVVWLN
jgi:hypothetical protein